MLLSPISRTPFNNSQNSIKGEVISFGGADREVGKGVIYGAVCVRSDEEHNKSEA